MTISSLPPVGNYSVPITSGGSTPFVASTSDTSLAQTAVTLSANASIVAALGASSSSANLTYNAAGLLNSLIQAGSASRQTLQANTSISPQAAQQAQDQSIIGFIPSPQSMSVGTYNASEILMNPAPTDLTSNFASLLQTNPELASTVTVDAMNQGIVGRIATST